MICASPAPRLSDAMSALLDRLRGDSDRVFGTGHIEIVPLTFEVRESSEVARIRVTSSVGIQFVFAKIKASTRRSRVDPDSRQISQRLRRHETCL